MWAFWSGLLPSQQQLAGLGLMLPLMMAELQFDTVQAGTLGAIGMLATAVFSIPLNAYLSRCPTKLVIAVLIGLQAALYFASAVAPDYFVLLVARGLGTLAMMSSLSLIAIVQGQWFPPSKMGTVKGLEGSSISAGQIVVLLASPLLLAVWGWRGTMLITGAAQTVALVVWLALAREKKVRLPQAATPRTGNGSGSFWAALRRREFLMLGLGVGAANVPYMAYLTFWPAYASESLGFSLAAAGRMLSLLSLGATVSGVAAGLISDRLGLRRPLPFLAGLALPLAYWGMLQPNAVILPIAAVAAGLCCFVVMPIFLAVPFELRGISHREVVIGASVIIACSMGGSALGAQLAGFLAQPLGMGGALLSLCVVPLALTICVALCPETGPRGQGRRYSHNEGRHWYQRGLE
jgi:predicted MFS family arabinose efflux permease